MNTTTRRGHAAATLFLAMVLVAGCHDADEPPERTPPMQVSEHVLENMRRGGRVRPVVYAPPPDLGSPDLEEIELPFPGPGTDGPGPEAVEEGEDEQVAPPPAAPTSPPPDAAVTTNQL